MTDEIRKAAIEAAAAQLHGYIAPQLAQDVARDAIDAYERAMWMPEGEAAVDADYLVRDAGGLIRVAFLRDTGEWCDSASFARIVVRRFRALPFIVPQPQEDEA